jgi:acyl carrier protein
MIPTYYMFVDKIPLNENGKVDIKALPNPKIKERTSFLAPNSETEKKISLIWKEILDIEDEISINDNFFEVGGNSIKIIQLSMKIKEIFTKEIPIQSFFQYPTISALVKLLDDTSQIDQGKKDEKEWDDEIDKIKQRLNQKRNNTV